jgi:hypothetical protein
MPDVAQRLVGETELRAVIAALEARIVILEASLADGGAIEDRIAVLEAA